MVVTGSFVPLKMTSKRVGWEQQLQRGDNRNNEKKGEREKRRFLVSEKLPDTFATLKT